MFIKSLFSLLYTLLMEFISIIMISISMLTLIAILIGSMVISGKLVLFMIAMLIGGYYILTHVSNWYQKRILDQKINQFKIVRLIDYFFFKKW